MSTKPIYDKIRVFIFNCVLVFLSYGIMLTHRYSIDGYAVYYECESSSVGYQHLVLGEPINWLVMNILHYFGINLVTGQKYFTFLFMVTAALCITALFFLFSKLIFGRTEESCGIETASSLGSMLFLDLAISLAFINVFINELFIFTECSIYWMGMMFFSVLATCIFLSSEKWWRYLLSIILLGLGVNFYQASLGFFLIFGCAGILVKNRLKITKTTVIDIVKLLFAGVFVSCISIAIFSVLKGLGITGENSRDPSLTLSGTISNAKYLLSLQKHVLVNGMSFIHLWLLIFLAVLLCVLAYLLIQNHYSFGSALLVFLAVLGSYTCVFAPHLLSKTIYPAVRTLSSFFSVFSLLCIIILYIIHRSHKKLPMALTCAVLAFLIINTVKIQQVAAEQFAINLADRYEALQVLNEIENYEKESGNSIDTIAYHSDGNTTKTYPGITNTYLDFGRRADGVSWAVVARINYYSSDSYRQIKMTDEEYSAHFPEKDWNVFDAEEQIVFVDNVMYWAIY